MKGRVEAGYLQELRLACPDGSDRGQVVGLMQRSERGKGVQPLEDHIVNDDGLAVLGAAVHDAMTDRRRQVA
jgi:hypothetical protein